MGQITATLRHAPVLRRPLGASLATDYHWMAPAGGALLGYLLGSIPFGLILTLVWLYIEFLRIIAIVFGRR